jgi:hypothetical protein
LTLPRSEALQDGKEHPTQKPVRLMAWCLDMHPKAQDRVRPVHGHRDNRRCLRAKWAQVHRD